MKIDYVLFKAHIFGGPSNPRKNSWKSWLQLSLFITSSCWICGHNAYVLRILKKSSRSLVNDTFPCNELSISLFTCDNTLATRTDTMKQDVHIFLFNILWKKYYFNFSTTHDHLDHNLFVTWCSRSVLLLLLLLSVIPFNARDLRTTESDSGVVC